LFEREGGRESMPAPYSKEKYAVVSEKNSYLEIFISKNAAFVKIKILLLFVISL
jgi:hypothetical protein